MRGPTRLFCLFFAIVLTSSGCARAQQTRFSVENARVHVDMLAGTIGSRPAGSTNNAKARAYLIDQLRLYGFDVRVQETDAVRSAQGVTARVANIIAIKSGARPDAIGLVAHYDSVPEAPGALDDGFGVAVSLEAGRVLAAQESRNHSLMIILTDGEELGLMGAAAVVTDSEVKGRLRAYLNVEATGAAGDAFMFESGPRNAPLLAAWAVSPRPRGSAYAMEIYKRLPNDTDFTIFRGQDIPGLNFAPIGDSYAYHTSRDTAERLSNLTLRHAGEAIVATAAALDQQDLTATAPPTATTAATDAERYFDFAERHVFVYSAFWGRTLSIVAVLIAVAAWVRVMRYVAAQGVLKLVISFFWGVALIAVIVGAMLGASELLRASREVLHPWYASPLRLLLLLIAAGLTAGWLLTRLMALLPEAARSLRAPAAVWALTLPIWAAFAAAMEYVAPAAAHLWVVPLLIAGVCLLAIPMRFVSVVRAASIGVTLLAWLMWLPDSFDLFRFIVPLFGRLPMITPSYVLPLFVALVAVVVAPPIVAALAGVNRGQLVERAISAGLLLAVAVTMGLSYVADAYTPERPLRRVARYVHDVPLGQAYWEVGGNEPGLDLSLSSEEAGRWRLRSGSDVGQDGKPAPSPPSPPLAPPLMQPFVFRADAPASPPPADVTATMTTKDSATELEVTIVPRIESVSTTIVLPPGVDPTTANLAGRRVGLTNRWRATFAAVPMSGIAFRATVPVALASKLAETVVLITVARGPVIDQPRVPAFLPQARTEWAVSSRWIVQPPLSPPAAPAAAPTATPTTTAPAAAPPTTLPGTPVEAPKPTSPSPPKPPA